MPNPNQPLPNQVPDHRFQEMQERQRAYEEKIARLEGTINYMAQQSQRPPPQADPTDQVFQPQVSEAIDKRIQRQLMAEKSQIQAAFNGLADRNDHLAFQVQYGVDTYKKYAPQIEDIRKQRLSQGQYVSREEAYKQVYFEENSRKPKEQPAAAAAVSPMFDPYTQKWVTPQGQEAQAPQAAQPQVPAQQPQVPAQQPQPQFQNPPLDVLPQVQSMPQNQPTYQRPGEQDFGLPPQDMPAPGTSGPSMPSQMGGLEITSDEKALDAWATKYGNVGF